MKKILIANDTMKSPNLGCQLVSRSIRDLMNKYFPDCQKDYICAFQRFEPQDLSQYSLVIINGEGSLGPRLKNAGNIFKYIESAYNSGVPCALINSSFYFAKSEDYKQAAPYLRKCAVVYARENLALKNFSRFSGVNVKMSADLGLHYCLSKKAPKSKKNYMVMSGGSFFKKKDYIRRPFNSKYNKRLSNLFSIVRETFQVDEVFLHSWPSRPHDDLHILSDILKEHDVTAVQSNNFESFYDYARKAKVVLTGRHHGIIMAVGGGTPFITYNSTLNKTLGDCMRYDMQNSYFDLDYRMDDWVTKVEWIHDNRVQMMARMRANLPLFKQSLDDMFKELVELSTIKIRG